MFRTWKTKKQKTRMDYRFNYPLSWAEDQKRLVDRIDARRAHLSHLQKLERRAEVYSRSYPDVSNYLVQWLDNQKTSFSNTATG